MDLLPTIERTVRKIAAGRSPSFTKAHVVIAMEMIGKEAVGRKLLSRHLALGEGATRTLVKHLKNEGIVEVSKYGITLTERGNKLHAELKSKISAGVEVPSTDLTVGPLNFAVVVRNVGHKVKRGLEQRDIAVKAGALGATTLIYTSNRVTMPSMEGEDIIKKVPHLHDILVSKLRPRENDVIVIGTGEDRATAKIGAKAVALQLLS